jgi:hypothetical protein
MNVKGNILPACFMKACRTNKSIAALSVKVNSKLGSGELNGQLHTPGKALRRLGQPLACADQVENKNTSPTTI